MAYSLTLHETTQAPADWGAYGLRLQCVSLAPDVLTFRLRLAIDAALPFAVGQACVLEQDGSTVFRGQIDAIDPVAGRYSEELQISAVGPWAWLERVVYEQTWQVGDGAGSTLVGQSKTRVIIGQDDAGAKRSIGAEISAAVGYAIAEGAPLALATVSIETTMHYQELVDVTCAELVRNCLRYLPDTMSWVDYATNPPTLHIARRADLDARSIAAGDCSEFSVKARPDLQARGVKLYFESTYQYNDTVYPQVAVQSAGTTTGERVVKATIALEGSGVTEERQRLKVQPISLTNAAFWVATVAALKGVAPSDLVVSSSSSSEEAIFDGDTVGAPLGNFLIEGNVSEWMGVNARRFVAKAKIKYTGSDATVKAQLGENEDRWYTLAGISTSGASKTYRRVTSSWSGESVPVGLAAAMYAAMSVVHYEGQAQIEGQECDFSLRPALLLNITGGRLEWATMAAALQTVAHDIDSGSTTLQFGPPSQLSPQAFAEMLRGNRNAKATYRLAERTGTATAAAINRGGEVQPVKDSQQSFDGYKEWPMELCDPDDPESDPVPGKILFKPDDPSATP